MLAGIVGLGLIGGSFAKAYTAAGHSVYAFDTNEQVLSYALLSGAAEGRLTDDVIPKCDIILVCTYPAAAINYIEQKGALFGSRPVVIDSCGIKREVVERGMQIAREHGFTYCGGHPMAGTQYSGFKYSRDNLFKGAPMVIVPPRRDDIALLNKIKTLLSPAGFGRISVTDAQTHDEVIAYTSKLAHVVSSAYIKSPVVRAHRGLSAGSYKDMTRVARLSPDMWTELCMANRDNLIKEIDILMHNLEDYKAALANGDSDMLKQLFDEGRRIKEEVDG